MNTTGKRKRVISATVSHDVVQDAETLAKMWGTTRSALIERGLVILIERALKEKEFKVEGEAHFEARLPRWKGRPAKRAGATGRKPRWMKEEER